MPDYNKGDFTQQGIDGFVEGGLHLNEKRCLTARISTDEDSAGLDSVEINIHDHLNDLDYTFSGENIIAGTSVIGQAPSGNIEITENGENINVAPYETATVNVPTGMQPTSATQYTLNNYGYTCEYDNGDYIYESHALPFVMNIKTSEVNYMYDNTEGTTICSLSGDGKLNIGDSTLTNTPFYVTMDLNSNLITIFGVDSNAHHLSIYFTAEGYPVAIGCQTNEDLPYIYVNENLANTYYLYLDPYGDGSGSRSGIIYTGLTNGVPRLNIVKFSGGPK